MKKLPPCYMIVGNILKKPPERGSGGFGLIGGAEEAKVETAQQFLFADGIGTT